MHIKIVQMALSSLKINQVHIAFNNRKCKKILFEANINITKLIFMYNIYFDFSNSELSKLLCYSWSSCAFLNYDSPKLQQQLKTAEQKSTWKSVLLSNFFCNYRKPIDKGSAAVRQSPVSPSEINLL